MRTSGEQFCPQPPARTAKVGHCLGKGPDRNPRIGIRAGQDDRHPLQGREGAGVPGLPHPAAGESHQCIGPRIAPEGQFKRHAGPLRKPRQHQRQSRCLGPQVPDQRPDRVQRHGQLRPCPVGQRIDRPRVVPAVPGGKRQGKGHALPRQPLGQPNEILRRLATAMQEHAERARPGRTDPQDVAPGHQKFAGSSPATISARRSSNHGGNTSDLPMASAGSSLAQPSGTVQAISNRAPPGLRTYIDLK